MNKERLLNVARALRESAHPEAFSMRDYADPECGTPKCALGHYASRTDLQDFIVIGWRKSAYSSPLFYVNDRREVHYDNTCVCDHFGIDGDEAEDLFGIEGCGRADTNIEAAEYFERFVENRDSP